MKTLCAPAVLLAVLYLSLLGYLAWSAEEVPQRATTHFDAAGQPNGWMSRSSYLLFTAVFGFVFPLFMVGICFVARFLPASLINIPRREYWLAAERRAETFSYLLRHSLWLACLMVVFVTGLHGLVIHANHQDPVRLSTPRIVGLAGLFLVGVTVWTVTLIRHFRRAS